MSKHTREFLFYMDDSGSRKPDRHPNATPDEPNWFALGGVIIDAADKQIVEDKFLALHARWPQLGGVPLHSYDIRHKAGDFFWLQKADASTQGAFYGALSDLMVSSPITAAACVVDRPGYNARYQHVYGDQRWQLCKTAFTIAVERAAKFARNRGARLRVLVERSDKATEQALKGYYDAMRAGGQPFDPQTSVSYEPLCATDLAQTLMEFKVKTKKSRLMQLADLALWPVCMGGYNPKQRNYVELKQAGRLLDAYCPGQEARLGIKYSCFAAPEKQKPADAGSCRLPILGNLVG